METQQEKLYFLKQLIEFAKIDGVLHDKELDFLKLLAEDFGIDHKSYLSLYHSEPEKVTLTFQDRIIQFYRLALLMQCDGTWHEKEINKIQEIGILMGLDPVGISKLLHEIKANGPKNITPEFIIEIFTTQLN